MRLHKYILWTFIAAIFVGCGSSNSKKVEEEEKVDPAVAKKIQDQQKLDNEEIFLPCSTDINLDTTQTLQRMGPKDQVFRISADLCFSEKVLGRQKVLFLNDVSASQQFSDPLKNGSCTRMKVMEKIISKYKSGLSESDVVNTSMIHFSDNIKSSNPKFEEIQDFKLNPNEICVAKPSTATYYKIALDEAKSYLQNKIDPDEEKNIPVSIFMITDGLPSDGTTAKETIQSLKNMNAEVNLIYYKWNDIVDPSILEKIVIDPKKLIIFENVDKFDASVNKITLPLPKFKSEDSSATVKSNEGEKDIVFKSISQASDERLSFLSEDFTLFGNKVTPVKNLIEVSAKAEDGKIYTKSIIVEFTLK